MGKMMRIKTWFAFPLNWNFWRRKVCDYDYRGTRRYQHSLFTSFWLYQSVQTTDIKSQPFICLKKDIWMYKSAFLFRKALLVPTWHGEIYCFGYDVVASERQGCGGVWVKQPQVAFTHALVWIELYHLCHLSSTDATKTRPVLKIWSFDLIKSN